MSKSLPYTIAVDADGVLWEDAYPEIGAMRTKTIEALRHARGNGVVLILNTCRTESQLDCAIGCAYGCAGIIFDFVNENDPRRIEAFGGDCRKVSADMYLEDKAAGWPGDDETVAKAIYEAVEMWLEARGGAAAAKGATR